MRNVAAEGNLVLRGVSLLDQRTGAHAALTMPADGQFRRVHSGDVKVYQNQQALDRAYLGGQATTAADDAAVLARLAEAAFEPSQEVVLLADGAAQQTRRRRWPAHEGRPHRRVSAGAVVVEAADAPLVLADTWYPGWQARTTPARARVK